MGSVEAVDPRFDLIGPPANGPPDLERLGEHALPHFFVDRCAAQTGEFFDFGASQQQRSYFLIRVHRVTVDESRSVPLATVVAKGIPLSLVLWIRLHHVVGPSLHHFAALP